MRIILLVGLLVCGLTPKIMAQEPLPKEAPAFTFEMRGKTWGAAFEWLVDKTGRPFISRDIPPGTFNFIARKDQKFTIPQIIDIINDGLLPQKFVLINRRTSFTLVPADVDVDPAILPRITYEEFKDHGHTEIVSMILKLKILPAKDLAPEVKKQMGPFGKAVALVSMNQLYLQDTSGNLERIIATIQDADRPETISPKNLPFAVELIPLTVLDAVRVAETLKAVFPESKNLSPYIEADITRNAIIVKGTAPQVADMKAVIRSLGDNDGSGNLRIITVGGTATLAEALQRIMKEVRPENPVRIIGPGGKIKE